MSERKWYLRTQDETFGPESRETLVSWAKMGRIQPGQEVSDDNVIWSRVEEVPFLDMRFSIDIGDGNPRGPFNQAAADALIASGRLPPAARVIETRAPFPPEEEPVEEVAAESEAEAPRPEVVEEPKAEVGAEAEEPKAEAEVEEPKAEVVEEPKAEVEEPKTEVVVEQQELFAEPSVDSGRDGAPSPSVVEKIVEKIVEVPVERFIEKIVEVPVEKIVEKEIRIEVPVEKIVEKIVTVVDETRVKELEGQLAEERDRVASLQAKCDESSKLASEQRAELARLEGEIKNGVGREKALTDRVADAESRFEQAMRDATDREAKQSEQILALEDELRRLPQTASEVADIQAAMFGVMTKEADEINALLAVEKSEMEEFRKRCEARCDRLLERRRELLKRAGADIEDMTRRALADRPEDPRTAQLRRELDELRRADEKRTQDAAARIRDLEAELRERDAVRHRSEEGQRDVTELNRENAALREQLRTRERELMELREMSEKIRRREAANQQAMVARLKELESPTIAVTPEKSAHQHREARGVHLPDWMRLGSGK